MRRFEYLALAAPFLSHLSHAFLSSTSSRIQIPSSSSRTRRITSHPRSHHERRSFLYVSIDSNTERNFYNILQVNRKATGDEIKQSYRRLAKIYHPDSNQNQDTTSEFLELNRAYEVLSDPSLKKMYDMFGESALGTSAASDVEMRNTAASYSNGMGSAYSNPTRPPNGTMDPDIYDTYFSGRSSVSAGSGSSTRTGGIGLGVGYGGRTGINQFVGDDVCIDFEVDFRTAILGGEAEVFVRSLDTCETCRGYGIVSDEDDMTPCMACDGTGVVTQVTSTALGNFSTERQCTECRGTGNASGKTCDDCEGKGVIEKSKAIKVTIPAGVDGGSKLQVCGEGDAGPNGGPSGDLYIFLKIQPDPNFRREGNDIYAEQTISCLDAMVGNTIRVPVVDGETTVEIPSGTQPGHQICLRGSGAPSLIGQVNERGDHYITINVEIPTSENDNDISMLSVLKTQAKLLAGEPKSPPSNFPKPPFSTVTEQHAKSIEVDFEHLEDLRAKAAEAKTERNLRMELEDVAASRKKEIEELTRRLEQTTSQLREETEFKLHFEELAAAREMKLSGHKRRLNELLSHFDD